VHRVQPAHAGGVHDLQAGLQDVPRDADLDVADALRFCGLLLLG
jgi:hypothetical protein